ncbi:MAG TPA: hypothetical protein VGM77_06370 [Gemmatimonadales bacterium]|jgi:hypothetical protein
MRRNICLILLGLSAACSNAGESLKYPSLAIGRLAVSDYFDRDASGGVTPDDTTFAGARFALLAPGGTDTLRTAVANASGVAIFDSVPVGAYRLVVDRHALGDSIGVVQGDTGLVRLVTTQDSITAIRTIGLGYSVVSLATARTLPVGRRVFVRGVVTVPLQTFSDTATYLNDSSSALRVTNAHPIGRTTRNGIGDSVMVLGTIAQVHGLTVLDQGAIYTLAIGPAPVPITVTVTDARTAQGGTLDAQLVKVIGTTIRDTATVNGVFVVRASDPADSTNLVDVLIDPALGAPASFFPIGSTMTITGALSYDGANVWGIKPRMAGDIIIP